MATVSTDLEHLEIILQELKEAVIVCDRNGRILLYNAEAKRLFRDSEAMGLGQSVYGVCARAPVEHVFRSIKHRPPDRDSAGPEQTDVRFVCAAAGETMLLHCRISRIDPGACRESIFIFTFEDITMQITAMGQQGYLLDRMIRDLRAPITNLNAAAENLKSFPEMAPEIRSEFEDVIFRESAELTRRFESIIQESGKCVTLQWPLYDVYSADLIGCVAGRFNEEGKMTVTMTGVPLWLHADSFSLMLVLECLVRFVGKFRHVSEVDIEALLGDRRVYIDIIWQGEPIPQADVDSMLAMTLPDTAAGMTVAEVLSRHDSEMWSQHHRRQGCSLLRIPVPDSPRQWEVPAGSAGERLEFYDFSLAGVEQELGDLADRPLFSLNYVVFDTETTGLRPSEGDEILAIAAVRIVNGRILSGEKFERLIKPENPIPEGSLRFLDITEEMVQGESPVDTVLPQFRAFVGDAVLVAHNGAFDMNFFRLTGEKSGIRFENPVLDTLLMTTIAEKERTVYTLESIGQWLGVEVLGNHTVMDDCFVTAQVFLRLVELLGRKGITTLGEIITASERIVDEKRQQADQGLTPGRRDA